MNHPESPQTLNSAVVNGPAPEYKQSSRLIFILGGIILLAIGLIAGYYLSQSSKPRVDSMVTPSLIPSPEVSRQMEGWKTFNSKYNKFSFKYPLEYASEDRENYSSLLSPRDASSRHPDVSQKELKIEVLVSESDSSDSLNKWVLEEKSKTEGTIEEIGTTKIDGVEAKIVKAIGVGIVKIHLVINNGKRYMMLKYPFATSRDAEFDQILSTFKFTGSIRSAPSCASQDSSFCTEVDKYIKLVQSEDVGELINKHMTTTITCDTNSPFNPSICNDVSNGSIVSGYQIGYNQSEGSVLSLEKYKEMLATAFNKDNYQYRGSFSSGNKGMMVFTNTSSEDLFSLMVTKESGRWGTKLLMIGVVSDDFLKQDARLLDLIR